MQLPIFFFVGPTLSGSPWAKAASKTALMERAGRETLEVGQVGRIFCGKEIKESKNFHDD
jgi:hypothetical protein